MYAIRSYYVRGFKYDRLNIVMNGSQSAIAACPNRMDPPTSQVPTSTIQKVEVYKGPYALRYGAGFGGTINFVSEPLVFTTKPEASRITSYNVCYTKLLRLSDGSGGGASARGAHAGPDPGGWAGP